MERDELVQLVEKLRELRRAREAQRSELIAAELELLHSVPAYADFVERSKAIEALESEIGRVETELRERAVRYYAETGERHPVDGVEIYMRRVAELFDRDALLPWLLTNLRAALDVNEDLVKRALETGVDVPGARLVEQPFARISRAIGHEV